MKSYWGLIIALLSEYLFRLIYSFFVYPYKVKFVIDKDKFYELYRFGGWLQLKNITSWFATNIDVAIVGNVLDCIIVLKQLQVIQELSLQV